ncbi:uncharacterized protein C8R40DRAFT_1074482 [Lentinula edodes]|uniref:uncharacterized protein n=1 Tax=Lentinula edodes TaxID=5353 RepID=UPI001E8D8EB0|nr:uncharacterized protein C8R40DRAFT_1074482 [Lentinula edodes]KAH7868867.1 hypothetical protein C8R40DRAFT_1074482 [Lentinula edodes]
MSAPIISPEALPSTPAHEWANETLNSVPRDSVISTSTSAPVSSSTATTPGLDFPGAYPKTPSTQLPVGVNELADRARVAASTAAAGVGDAVNALPAVETISGSVAGGLDGVKEVLFNATVTASQYLPSNVVEYFPGGSLIVAASTAERDAQGISLPSAEHSVDPIPSSQGVGSLPGPSSEEGVAKLPLERDLSSNHSDELKIDGKGIESRNSLANASMVAQDGSSAPTPTTLRTPVQTPVQHDNISSHFTENLNQEVPPSSSPTHPSKEKSSIKPAPINLIPRTHPLAASGVGAHWHGVPLDEEYQKHVVDKSLDDTQTSSTAIDADIPVPNVPPIATIPPIPNVSTPSTVPVDSMSSIAVSSPSQNSPRVAKSSQMSFASPHSPQNDSTIANVGHDKLTSGTPEIPSPHHDVATPSAAIQAHANHAKEISEPSSAFSTSTPSSTDSSFNKGAVHGKESSNGAESVNSTPSNTPLKKKTTLLSKLKGEAKIISGKLGGKEEKVEEGRRLIRGEVE